ncbi:MAG: hypothetical protein KDD45_01750 [Bdellovibrionales bacterium]|nr:hypothetical protein [Bdellovibrionales bacterium]
MIKVLISILTFIGTVTVNAQPLCKYEMAQVYGTVKSVQVWSNGCQAFLTANSHVKQDKVCPLNLKLLSTS